MLSAPDARWRNESLVQRQRTLATNGLGDAPNVPVYGICPRSSAFMLIRRDLARSMGLIANAATTFRHERRSRLRH